MDSVQDTYGMTNHKNRADPPISKHQVCFFKRRSEAQYSRIAIMDYGKSNVANDGIGCALLDNAGAYCPDVPSLLLLRRYCTECRITFDVAALGGSKGGSVYSPLWVSSPARQII
jgi:hypothetical protein